MEEDVTDASGVVEAIQKSSRPSHALPRTGAVLIHKMAEPSKDVTEDGMAKLVAGAAMSPMLFAMSADGTSNCRLHSSRLPFL